jgi:hypothetical protein
VNVPIDVSQLLTNGVQTIECRFGILLDAVAVRISSPLLVNPAKDAYGHERKSGSPAIGVVVRQHCGGGPLRDRRQAMRVIAVRHRRLAGNGHRRPTVGIEKRVAAPVPQIPCQTALPVTTKAGMPRWRYSRGLQYEIHFERTGEIEWLGDT